MLSRIVEPCALIRVQSWQLGASVPKQAEHFLGVSWPHTAGAVASGQADVICLGPTDWLLVGTGPVESWMLALTAALSPTSYRATDLSSALSRIRIAGASARMLLATACALHVFSPEFTPGRAARTLVAGVPTVIRCLPRSVFECLVPVSYADYVMRWLTDAAAGYQIKANGQ